MRALLVTLALAASLGAQATPPRLIAHRGGVVDEKRPENSIAAIEEAARRGYWAVEIDIQETRDGRLIVQHDDFDRSYGVKRKPRELAWSEIAKLRAQEDGSRPLELHEAAALARGRLRLMIDTKGASHPPAFYRAMEETLRRNGLLDDALIIGSPESRAWFRGKARIGVDRAGLEAAIRAGEPCSRRYFLFEHGRDLDQAALELAQRAGVLVVPSINVFHYAGQDHMTAARADVERLRRAGLVYFQIDAVYDAWLR
jgi:glycerophosphoryl diester phosphodiesterase